MRWMSFSVFILAFFILILSSFITISPAVAGSQPQLYFQNRHLDPLKEKLVPKLLPEDSAASTQKTEEPSVSTSFARTMTRLFSFSADVEVEKYDYYIIQFNGPVQEEWKETLKGLGAVFHDYVPQYAFIVKLGTSKVDSVKRCDFVRWIGEYEPELKLSNRLFDVTPGELEKRGGLMELRILAFPGESRSALLSSIRTAGGTVLSEDSSDWGIQIGVSIPVEKISALKDIKGVKWIERAPRHRMDNNISTGIIEARFEQEKVWPVSGTKLFGKGQLIAICDSGIDSGDPDNMHKDFSDGQGGSRVTDTVFDKASAKDYIGHGTHVAGTVAGNGMASGASPQSEFFPSTSYAGIAPEADLFFQSVGAEDGSSGLPGIPSDISELFQPAYDAGARIHTNSWGTSGAGSYSSESLTVDQFMWTNKDFLILYAAGNNGYDKDMNGIVDPYSIDSPATAKNCLSVGASESYRMGADEGFASRSYGLFRTYAEPISSDLFSDKPYGLASFSSRGPTLDGRYKPEVVAPGTNILSTRSSFQVGDGWGPFDDNYYWSGGTSMATPLVAGMAALMREYLIEEERIADPSAALIKTGIIHGSVSLAPGQFGTEAYREISGQPDFAQGWGRVDLSRSINSDSSCKIEYHDIKSSAPADNSYVKTFTFDVEDANKPFKATLGWTDYPGTPAVQGGLVNDLDLRVQKPDGTWVYPDNAMGLSSLTQYLYVSSVSGFYTGSSAGIMFTPPSYPCSLESVLVAFRNENSLVSQVDVVVYSYSGGVGEELFRKSFAYIPSGEYALPVGLNISSGNIVVAVEKTSTSLGVCCATGNPTSRGLVKDGGVWQTATITPAIVANFRTASPATDLDHINNTESVTIENPEYGIYKAEVSVSNLPEGPQPYALVMSGMVGEKPTDGEVEIDTEQPDAPPATLLHKSSASCSAESVNAGYGTSLENVYSAETSFRLQTLSDSTLSIKYAVSGLPAISAEDLVLTKLYSNGTSKDFKYAGYKNYSDGNWWLSDVSGHFIDPNTKLSTANSYYVVSVIKDGGEYDVNPETGVIDDPQILGSNSPAGSAGCVIGTDGDIGVPVLILFALLAIALRFYADRRSKEC